MGVFLLKFCGNSIWKCKLDGKVILFCLKRHLISSFLSTSTSFIHPSHNFSLSLSFFLSLMHMYAFEERERVFVTQYCCFIIVFIIFRKCILSVSLYSVLHLLLKRLHKQCQTGYQISDICINIFRYVIYGFVDITFLMASH